ncbi:M23 family metallopeptidase [Erythrobacter sp. YT30]|uniref:M23 family metallopeptidase n=1 Tax=Erythrobacter sp. YT30 TaxID=1735012 RepID=UPI0009E846EA|nr:M23 family metallopeptidase [Erythrobacter sp. YT30]
MSAYGETASSSDFPSDEGPFSRAGHRVFRITREPKRSGFAGRFDRYRSALSDRLAHIDLAPDLAENIGSLHWFRGMLTMLGLGALALALWPDMSTASASAAMPDTPDVHGELRSQMIMPLALGGDSGRRMGPTAFVKPLKSAPERPQIELMATLAEDDSFSRMLRRAGVSASDIGDVSALVGGAMSLSEIEPGTQMDLILGRRPAPGAARPLDVLKFRARFDLELKVARNGADPETGQGGSLSLVRNFIRVDDTPLRVRGEVGSSLYRSMRAAGVPASVVQEYLRTLDNQIDLDREVRESDTFDIILSYRRAETGERQAGKLLYAGVDRDGKPRTQLMRWGEKGQFFEASGVGEQRRGLIQPVNGPISSRYGMRRHPILGYRRMHAGQDYRARSGTPIVAVSDGRVVGAGRMGGCGIAVRVNHGGGLETRSCHMSRMAVRRGEQVRRGQVIGYVGSTGLSTGPHLHFEMYRNGRAVNPASVRYVTRAALSGVELLKFKEQLTTLKLVEPGAALEDLTPKVEQVEEPAREIEKINSTKRVD